MQEPAAFVSGGWRRLPTAASLRSAFLPLRSAGRGHVHLQRPQRWPRRPSTPSSCSKGLRTNGVAEPPWAPGSTRPESRRGRARAAPRQRPAVGPRDRGPCATPHRFVFCVCEIQASKAHSSGRATTSPASKDGADALNGVRRNRRQAAGAPGHEGGTWSPTASSALGCTCPLAGSSLRESRMTGTWHNACRGNTC